VSADCSCSSSTFHVLGAAVPLALWSLYYLAGQLRYSIQWPPDIWTGSMVLAMLSGVGLSLLAAPPSAGRVQRRETGTI